MSRQQKYLPREVAQIGGKLRIVMRGTTTIARSDNGKPVDGGGHKLSDMAKAKRQVENINDWIRTHKGAT